MTLYYPVLERTRLMKKFMYGLSVLKKLDNSVWFVLLFKVLHRIFIVVNMREDKYVNL